MSITDKIYEIIEEYGGSGEIDECAEDIEWFMERNVGVKDYKIHSDTDVFDSCGLGIFYVAVSWIDTAGELHICGDRLTSR